MVAVCLSGCGRESRDEARRAIAGSTFAEVPQFFDVCPDGKGGILAAWAAHQGDYVLEVSHLGSTGRTWSAPHKLVKSHVSINGVYLGARGREIDLFYSWRLRHMVSRDLGETWEDLVPALQDSEWVAWSCGFATRNDRTLDMIAMRSHLPEGVGPVSLVGLEIRDGAPGPITEIATLPDGLPTQPKPILHSDGRVEVAYVVFNHMPRVHVD